MSSARGADQTPALTSREAFGELRSLLAAGPSAHGWDLICDLFDRLERGPEREQARRELVPYALIGLERWPERLRVAPPSWVRAVMDDAPTPAGLQLARVVVIDGETRRVEQLRRLADAPELEQAREVRLTSGAISGKALGALLERRGWLAGLEVSCHGKTESMLNTLLGRKGPSALERLALRGEALGAAALAQLPEAPLAQTLRALTLTTRHDAAEQLMRALCALPCAQRLESLDLSAAPLDDAALRIKLRSAPAASLRRLALRASWLAPESMAALGAWIGRCEGLEALVLAGGVWRGDATVSQIEALMPETLTRLAIELDEPEPGDPSGERWAQALPAGLRELTALCHHRDTTSAAVGAALGSRAAAGLTTLKLRGGALDADASEALPALTSLTLEQTQIEASAAAALAHRMGLPALRALHIRYAETSPDTLRALSEAPWWPRLEALTFNMAGYTSQLAPSPLAALPASLTALDLSDNALTAAHLDALLSSPAAANLRELRLDGCSLPAGSFIKLMEALPDMKALERLSLRRAFLVNREDLLALAGCSAAARLTRLTLGGVRRSAELHSALMSSPHLSLSAKDHMDDDEDSTMELWPLRGYDA